MPASTIENLITLRNGDYGNPAFDKKGRLFFTVNGDQGPNDGHGRIVMAVKDANGWTYKPIVKFWGEVRGYLDGSEPSSPLKFLSDGTAIGTTDDGGIAGCGTIFMLSESPTGLWAKKNIVSLKDDNRTPCYPAGPLSSSSNGSFVGASIGGGNSDGFGKAGTVYRLSRDAHTGNWVIKTIVRIPYSNLAPSQERPNFLHRISDKHYIGTTSGRFGIGSGIFEIKQINSAKDEWKFANIHEFVGGRLDGFAVSSIIVDNANSIYGITKFGGKFLSSGCYSTLSPDSRCGTLFHLSRVPDGAWTFNILYNFDNNGKVPHPANPTSIVPDIENPGSFILGTAAGGPENGGVLMRLSPPNGSNTNWSVTVIQSFTATTSCCEALTVRGSNIYGISTNSGLGYMNFFTFGSE
jgi:hypothetical protein